MKRYILILSILSAGVFASAADVFTLKNGDRISGAISAKTADSITIATSYGSITVPSADVVSTTALAPTDKTVAEASADAMSQQTPAAPVATTPPPPAPRTFIEDYKQFIHETMPEGWEFRLAGGMEYRKVTSETLSYSLKFNVKKDWDVNHFDAGLYYDYATETPPSGAKYTSLDKYGILTNFSRDIGVERIWFWKNSLNYGVDRVRGIKDQVDEIASFGRNFKLLDDTLEINISAGPAVRYVNAENLDTKWFLMGAAMQDLTWKFHEYMRLEEKAYYGMVLTNYHQYNFNFSIGAVCKVNDVLDLALRYYYNYDAINASDALREEQRLMIMFEIPFK